MHTYVAMYIAYDYMYDLGRVVLASHSELAF